MLPSRLPECLLRDGMLGPEVVRAATARQAVYGGALDTALLELQALDEMTLWAALAAATQVPAPEAAMFENPDPAAAAQFGADWSRRCRAVPVGEQDGRLQMLCSEPIDEAGLLEACAALGVSCEVYVVPEVRLAAARQVVYGEPVPPRLLRLLSRLMGPQVVRRWVQEQTRARRAPPDAGAPAAGEAAPAPVEFDVSVRSFAPAAPTPVGRAPSTGVGRAPVPAPVLAPSESTSPGRAASASTPKTPAAGTGPAPPTGPGEEELCRLAQDPDPNAPGRIEALRALRSRLGHPRVKALTEKLRRDLAGPTEIALVAASALGELRDPDAVPALVASLQGSAPLIAVAHRTLIEIAKQDFGTSRRRWSAWWERHQGESRTDWLFEGLSHKAPEIRMAASEELRALTGEYFGYHFDLPKRDREDARLRWQAWWRDGRRPRPTPQ